MKDLNGKVTREGDLMSGFCARGCLTEKTCTLLDHHKSFAGCDLSADVLRTAESDLLLKLTL